VSLLPLQRWLGEEALTIRCCFVGTNIRFIQAPPCRT